MSNGTVKFFNAGKGFGFITSDAGNKDIFVPSASLTASGISSLKPGQRVSFEELPDGKGPKAVKLLLLSEAPRPPVLKEGQRPQQTKARSQLTYYHDHTSEWSSYVLTTILELGHEPAVVRYLETSPAKDELRGLSRLLRSNGQNLVRRYDPLFMDLRLDDRFIGDNEYWEAIMEHPVLIDGPLLATEIKANLCHSDEAVAKFFAETPSGAEQSAAKPKGLSARALQILTGDAVPLALNVEVAEAEKDELLEVTLEAGTFARGEAAETAKQSRKKAEVSAPVKTQSRVKAPPKIVSEVKAKTIARPKPKSAALAKPKKSPKSAARKISKSR